MSDNKENEFSSLQNLMKQAVADEVPPTMEHSVNQSPTESPVDADTQLTASVDAAYDHFASETANVKAQQTPVKTETSPMPSSDAPMQVKRSEEMKYEPTPNETSSDFSSMLVTKEQDSSSLDIMTAINAAINNVDGQVGTFRAAALKSGYAFEVEPLRFVEIERLINSVGDVHAEQVKLIKTVFSKIKWFSCGHLSYTDFINCTAYDDFDTILYAIYCATYAGLNKYPIKCQSCGEENNIEVNSDKLISSVDEEKLLRVREILTAASTTGEPVSLPLDMREKLKLNSSGIVIEYGISSLGDYLAGVARMQAGLINSKTGKVDNSKSELTSMVDFELAVDYIYVPNPQQPGGYLQIKDAMQKTTILSRLSYLDGPQFKQHLKTLRKKYRVDYTIPKFNCAHCGTQTPELALNFEQLLFTEMKRETES